MDQKYILYGNILNFKWDSAFQTVGIDTRFTAFASC